MNNIKINTIHRTVKENVNEEQQEPLTTDDEDSDNESLDTQVTSKIFKMNKNNNNLIYTFLTKLSLIL